MALVSFSGNRKKITSMNFFTSDFLAFVADKIDADLIQKYYRSIFSIICCKNFLQEFFAIILNKVDGLVFWPGRLSHHI